MDTPTPRLLWPDLAKGLCILLVVLHHVTAKHYPTVAPATLQPLVDGWVELSYALKPVRMPLFFVLSGFFAASALDRPWPAALRRVVTSGYLYVVWLLLLFGFFAVERTLETNRTQDLGELALDLLWPSTGVWFLWALGAYLLVLRALRRVPDRVVLVGAGLVAVATSWLPVTETNRISVVFHFVFFAVGALRPGLVRRLASPRAPAAVRRPVTGPRAALTLTSPVFLTPAFALLSVVMVTSVAAPRSVELLALSALGVPLGLSLAAALARVPWVARPVAWVGRRTLPIYVLHMPVLAALVHLPHHLDAAVTPGSVLVALAYPLLATALVAAGCLALHALLRGAGLGWLFALPGPVADRWPTGITRAPHAAVR